MNFILDLDEDEEVGDPYDLSYKNAEHLVHETKVLSNKLSTRMNLAQLRVQQTVIGSWQMVQSILWQQLDRLYRS